jgi:hypothetical protein
MDDRKIVILVIVAIVVYFIYKGYLEYAKNKVATDAAQSSYDHYAATLAANANKPEETDWMAYGYTLLNPASMFFGSAI